jgi:hypothetical protein
MTRKRTQHHPQKKSKKQQNQTTYIIVTAILIIGAISALILLQDPGEKSSTSNSQTLNGDSEETTNTDNSQTTYGDSGETTDTEDDQTTNGNTSTSNDGTWLFAMDTRSEYVGGYEEYRTGYIPTLVIIDIDGNIVHKSAGVHTKEDLLDYVQQAEESSSARTKAPDFTLNTLYGSKFTLSSYKGTPVILDLMAVRCPPCKTQMPELQKLKKDLGNDVVILSVDVDGAAGSESAQDVIDEFGEYIKEE